MSCRQEGCSTWSNFCESYLKVWNAISIHYIYESITQKALHNILSADNKLNDKNESEFHTEKQNVDESSDVEALYPIRKKIVFFKYRGKVTNDHHRALK